MEDEKIEEVVKKEYGKLATAVPTCGFGCSGYGSSSCAPQPLDLGCGKPVPLANLKPGETVLDLGSGAGLDAIFAAQEVGEEGKVIGVQPDGLQMKVSKSSDRHVQPKGRQLIPRQSISVLQVTDYRKLGRLLGTTGAMAATAGIVAAQNIGVSEGPGIIVIPAMAAAGTVGAGIGGYYVGKAFDKRVTEIRVIPEQRPAGSPVSGALR